MARNKASETELSVILAGENGVPEAVHPADLNQRRSPEELILMRVKKRVNAGIQDFRTVCGDYTDKDTVKQALKGLMATVEGVRMMIGE